MNRATTLLHVAAAAGLLTALPGRALSQGKTVFYEIVHLAKYSEIYVVPAPDPQGGGVTIDGRLDDWDLSGAVRVQMDDLEPVRLGVTAAMMYDHEALYVGALVRDPTPMMNRIPDSGLTWKGDHLSVRLLAAPAPEAYNRFDRGELDHRVFLNFWYSTPASRANFDINRQGESGNELNPAGVTGAFLPAGDRGGYTLEYRVPWTVIRPVRQFAEGDKVRVMFQMHWGDRFGDDLLFGVTFPRHPEWNGTAVKLYAVPESWGTGVFGKPAAATPEPARRREYSQAVLRELSSPVLGRPEPESEGDAAIWRLTPEMDLQSAADRAGPGHVLELAPGIYRQSLVLRKGGAEGRPLVLRAAQGGTATLSGVARGLKLDFERMDGQTYRAAVPWPVFWVRAEGRNLVNFLNFKNFKSRSFGSRAPGPPEGFCRDEDGYLHIRLKDGTDPAGANLEIEGAALSHVNVRLSGASHVLIEGLRLDMAPYAGVFLEDCGNVTIRDCCFTGCNRGIRSEGAGEITVEHCEFSGYPTCQWIRGGPYWSSLYESLQSATFITGGGPGWRVRNNFVYECFDSFQVAAAEGAQEYAYNLVVNSADDGFEFDYDLPGDHPARIRIHHNVILDAWDTFSLAPHSSGRLLVDHNVVYDSPEYGRAPWNLTFKLAQHGDHLGDVSVVHNTLLNRRFGILGPVSRITRIGGFLFLNNIIEEVGWSPWEYMIRVGMTVDEHNLYCPIRRPAGVVDPGDPPPLDGGEHPHSDQQIRDRFPGLKHYAPGAGFVSDPARVQWWNGPNAGAFEGYRLGGNAPRVEKGQLDVHLAPDSPAVDGGVVTDLCPHTSNGDAPDLGAVELGSEWDFPRPGPRWANFENCPWRPPLPPSFDPRMAGFKPDERD